MHAGTDPLTGRRLRFRQTVETEKKAQIVLGRLLEQASAGQRPDSGVTVAELLARYMEVAELDVSTRETYECYIRRTLLPALGSMELRKDTKTHQHRHLVIDPVTCSLLAERRRDAEAALAGIAVPLPPSAYVFSGDLLGAVPWNPDWVTHKVAGIAQATGVRLNIKALRHYTASQLLAGGIDLRNTAARLGHGSGGATTLRHYADPVSEVDRRAAAYLAQLTAPAASGEGPPRSELTSAER